MKKLHILLLSTLMCVGLSACSTGGSNTGSSDTVYNPFVSKDDTSDDGKKEEPEKNNSDEIKIEDIDWEIKEGIHEGKRKLLFSYTNNSDYEIVNVRIKFSIRPNTSVDKLKIFNDLKDLDGTPLSEDEQKEITLLAPYAEQLNVLTAPGATYEPQPCRLDGGISVNKNLTIDHYNVMEPDMAVIEYLSNSKVYSNFYDFKNETYTNNNVVNAYEWSSNALANMLPKPDLIIGKVISDRENYYSFEGYNTNNDFFKDYLNKCKEKGFNVEVYENGGFFDAKNTEGYSINVTYSDYSKSISISIDKPEEQK